MGISEFGKWYAKLFIRFWGIPESKEISLLMSFIISMTVSELPVRSFLTVWSRLEFDNSIVSESQHDFFSFLMTRTFTSLSFLLLQEHDPASMPISQSMTVAAKLKFDKISKTVRPDIKYFFIMEITEINLQLCCI